MAIMQTSGQSPEGFLRRDDQVWLQDVLDLIPRSVYGDDSPRIGLNENSENDLQKSLKTKSPKKTRRANKWQTKEINNATDSRHASLKRKLHDKILEKRTARKADDESYMVARVERKRKRDEKSSSASREGKKRRADNQHLEQKRQKPTTTNSEDGERCENRKRKLQGGDENGNVVSLETTRVAGFGAEKPARKVKRRKLRGNKLVELQKQLEEVNKQNADQQKEREASSTVKCGETGETGDGGEARASKGRKREMEKAMQRARGIDVKDDAKKLKKSIRKEKRKSEKSREEWAKRKKSQEMEQKSKQEKKARNLEERKTKTGFNTKRRAGLGKKR